jgi:hypothetical protein
MFRPRVAAVQASKKLSVAFQWTGTRLEAVHSVYEDKRAGPGLLSSVIGLAAGGQATAPQPTAGDRDQRDFYFEYYPDFPQVLRVGGERIQGAPAGQATGGPRAAAPSPAAQASVQPPQGEREGSWSFVTLFNNPRLDPLLASRIVGRRVAQGFAPNPLFHPFAWEGVYLFEFAYDEQGRVEYAWCKNPPPGWPRAARYEFTWDGNHLTGIILRAEGKSDAPILYQRTLNYSANKLVSETILVEGKRSRIDYKYSGNRLVEAVCDDDPSIDNRSRRATFVD